MIRKHGKFELLSLKIQYYYKNLTYMNSLMAKYS